MQPSPRQTMIDDATRWAKLAKDSEDYALAQVMATLSTQATLMAIYDQLDEMIAQHGEHA